MTHQRCFYAMLFMVGCSGSIGTTSPGGDNGGGGGSSTGSGSGSDGSGSGSDDGVDVLPTYPTQHPRIYLTPNMTRLQAAITAKTAAATRLQSIADNWAAGTSYWGFQSWNAAILTPLTGDPKYCTAAIADVEAQVSTAESAIAAGQQPVVANDSYLDVGDYIGNLALVYDWCNDMVSSTQKTRWLAYANQAVWNVWHHDQAVWGSHSMPWSGWATDDPSDNYYYSFLSATMLLGLAEKGEDPAGDTWISQFRDTKVLGQLVPTFDADLVGGGSREGTGYGVAMRRLFQIYDFWKATTGEKLAGKTKHTRASMLSFMHQVVPTLDRFAPTGDQSRDSTASMFDYQRNYLQELVHIYNNDNLAKRAQALLSGCSVPVMANSFMAIDDFLYDNSDVSATSVDGGTAYYAPGIGELYARSGWDSDATWINMIAGPYTESHAHQDQGSLLIYKGGWLAYDAVIDSHSGLRQETGAHGLVRILSGGSAVPQIASTDSTLVGLHSGTGWLYAAADTTAAYNGSGAVAKSQREIVYLQPDVIVVYDRVTSASGTSQVWSLASPKQPSISGTTATFTGAHALHVQRLSPSATASVFNYATQDPSGDYGGGFRLDETVAGGDTRFLHVLSLDGSVLSATAADDSTVTVSLSNGQTATVAFTRADIGATLTYNGATTTLGAGIDQLPE